MNRKVYLLALLLISIAAASITAKVYLGGQTIEPKSNQRLWRVNIIMNITGKAERAKVRLTLPQSDDRQQIYNEHFENEELMFYIRERSVTGNRLGFWRSELLDGFRSLRYTFSTQLKSRAFALPVNLEVPKDSERAYGPDFKTWLDPSKLIQSKDPEIVRLMKKAVGRQKNAATVVRRIFDYVRGEVKYRSEKGSKDARETLKKLVADCGGQARLFVAMSRAAGIPSRVVGGLVLTPGVKSITHVWAENYIGGVWVPFDVVNNHFAVTPNYYLELYRGDYALIKHLGLSKFEFFFTIGSERMPPVDNPWSLYVLPIHFQRYAKIILLIPVGALVVAFFRNVVGVQTFGTFAPILLALAFREISLWVGLLCLAAIIFFGWLLRKGLDHLKILVIPRLSIIVTMVVMFVLAMMVVGYHFGFQKILVVSLFPMIIMTWTVERFSVLQIEDGTPAALKAALGTTVVATAAYSLMRIHELRAYLFTFPELLLAIMGLQFLIGRYTGIRLTELWRFRELRRLKQQDFQ